MADARNKRIIIDKISKLSATEHDEIFKILARCNIGYTQNSNGVFFNFSCIPNEVLSEIETFVNYCEKNQKELEAYDKRINSCLLNGTHLITPTPKQTNDDLENVLQSSLEDISNIKWKEVADSSDKVKSFVSMLENNLEKIHKKNNNTKFINAKKRYSRRLVSDKKTYNEYSSNLYKEEYTYYKNNVKQH